MGPLLRFGAVLPSASGSFKGQGWTRKREEAWDRVFAEKPQTVALPDQAQELLERGFYNSDNPYYHESPNAGA